MVESFDEKTVKGLLGIPEDRRAALMITMGYAADSQREKKRKGFEKVVRWDGY
jgi:nitroreductase